MPSLLIPLADMDVLPLFAENEQLLTLTAQLQWSLISVCGTFAKAMAENAKLTLNSDQQLSLFCGKIVLLTAENAELKLEVADLTYKLGSAKADLHGCIQDRQQMMQNMQNMQPSALW